MSVNEIASTIKSRFDYLVCLDLIVFVCIFVIASRPDGLAITIGAVVVGAGILIYRCVAGVKNRLAQAKPAPRKAEHQFGQRARPAAASAAPVPAKASSKSWLRDSE